MDKYIIGFNNRTKYHNTTYMTFNNDKAIYLQMADRLCDEIITGAYGNDDRIPSVREYAVMLEVNTNTAVKAYESLARDGIIYNRRGLGYFVAAGAKEHIIETRRKEFIQKTLPELFRQMRLLGITPDDVMESWNKNSRQGQPDTKETTDIYNHTK